LSGGIAGSNDDLKTEALQSADEGAFELLGVTAIEIVCSWIPIRLMILEHVKHDDQNGVSCGDYGSLLALARG
jgi:hypothetical protein